MDDKIRFVAEMGRKNEQFHISLENNQKNNPAELEMLQTEINRYFDSIKKHG